jgi:hypothetical protein
MVQALKKFAYIRSALLYKKRLRKFGPSYIYDKYLSQIKGTLSLVTTSAFTQMDQKEGVLYNSVHKELKNFFEDYMWKLMSIKMLQKTKRLFELIFYMQVKIQRNRITIENQTQVLLNYWNSLNLKLLKNAVEHQDDGMNHLLVQIQNVPLNVRHYLLESYVKQCRKFHSIAFLQWRLHFSEARKLNNEIEISDTELQEMI